MWKYRELFVQFMSSFQQQAQLQLFPFGIQVRSLISPLFSTEAAVKATATDRKTIMAAGMGAGEMPLFLNIPCKTTMPVKWAPVLLQYIEKAYAEDPARYEPDAHELDHLREVFMDSLEPSLITLNQFFTYYAQVAFVCTRFPFDVGLELPWHLLFSTSGSNPVTLSNLKFEKANVLFCIGAIYSQLGCNETRISTEGLRKSCNFFQNAAGCFKYIAKEIISDFQMTAPTDLLPSGLTALMSLMLAQAQECIWQKAMMEHMKPGTIARLALKASDLYKSSLDEQREASLFPADWCTYLQIKANYFLAAAQYYKANECISQGRYGEEISRLRLARSYNTKASESIAGGLGDLLKSSTVHVHDSFAKDIKTLEESIKRDLVRAEKDNDLVYLETIPEPDQLPPILKSDMVRPIVPPEVVEPTARLKATHERPLFEKLVPFAVHQAASVYMDKKDFIMKNNIIVPCTEMQEESQKLIKEMNLPESIDVVDPEVIPAKLIACAEETQHEGGGQAIRDMLFKVQQMSLKNTELVNEGFNVLEEENEQDEFFRRQYGNLWTRPPSQQLTSTLLSQGSKYYDTLQAAQKADRIVHAKVSSWGRAIDVLSKPVPEIIASLPSMVVEDENAAQLPDLIRRLRDLLQEVKEAETRQKHVLEEAKSLAEADDISEALLAKATELTGGSSVVKIELEQFNEVFAEELRKYDGLQSRVQDFCHEHERTCSRLQETYEQYLAVVRNHPVAAKREKAIQNLELAFVKFKEIRTNLVEGIKFYSQYADTLAKFRDACVEFAYARRNESSEIVREGSMRRP
ncbi:BRO1-like domain-containing protein [Dichotomocladium elegans]|nr:BRO1-like domain-containing protein [Dichotomocladium elegans]